MNKVITIHLNGTAFQLEEDGYDALRAYLDNAARQLQSNPDRTEILADIEQALADKFHARLGAGRNVVLTAEVEAILAEIGPVDDGSAAAMDEKNGTEGASGSQRANPAAGYSPPPKRLYRLTEGAKIFGVCNGLAAYLGIDVTILRLIAVLLAFFSFGTLLIIYIVARIVIPKARTPEEKAAAAGHSPTAHEFVRMARDGYYEGLKSIHDRDARREWKRKFRREMRDWRRSFRSEMRWGRCCEPPCGSFPPPAGFHVILPVLSLLKALLVFLFVFAILSLLATGSIFGFPTPAGLPVWAGVILLILAYKVVVAPIKALRRAAYFRAMGRAYLWHPLAELWHGLIVVMVVVLCVWLADCLVPGFHHVLQAVPGFLHNAAETVQQWWTRR